MKFGQIIVFFHELYGQCNRIQKGGGGHILTQRRVRENVST